MRQRPFESEEFLRSRVIIPYDYETQVLHEWQDEARARQLFVLRVIRRRRKTVAMQILSAIWFCIVAFAALYIGAGL